MAGIKTYLEESYEELVNKVTWPTWRELQESTILVFITLMILALIIFLMDFIFGVSGDAQSTWKGMIGFLYSLIR
ncbi:MAG: preprotein translocase subunit SecE [Flavobacteriales bacterium]|jgi:preprotein translocase subunit SecE